MKKILCNKRNIIIVITIFLIVNVNYGLARTIRNRFGLESEYNQVFDSDYLIQEKLLKNALFSKNILVGDELISFEFTAGNVDYNTAREIADLVLSSEEDLAERGVISPGEAVLVRQRRENFDSYTEETFKRLIRNPWSIIAKNQQGQVVGVVFSGLIYTESVKDLPDTWDKMTYATLERARSDGKVNTYVDFWYTGKSKSIAKAVKKASLLTSDAIRQLNNPQFTVAVTADGKKNFYAYSNPRALWKWKLEHPEGTIEEYREGVENGEIRDPALGSHLNSDAEIAYIMKAAFPFHEVTVHGRKEKVATGSGYAFIMRYP